MLMAKHPVDLAFDAWVATLPAKHWARYDLSAARLGWDAQKTHVLRDFQATVAFGDDFVFTDIAAARVMPNGEIVRTVNGAVITPGTDLFVLPPKETT